MPAIDEEAPNAIVEEPMLLLGVDDIELATREKLAAAEEVAVD